jgi:hypothetical protein
VFAAVWARSLESNRSLRAKDKNQASEGESSGVEEGWTQQMSLGAPCYNLGYEFRKFGHAAESWAFDSLDLGTHGVISGGDFGDSKDRHLLVEQRFMIVERGDLAPNCGTWSSRG